MLDEYLNKDLKTEVNDSVSRMHDWNTRLGQLLLIVKDNQFEKFKSLLNVSNPSLVLYPSMCAHCDWFSYKMNLS